MYEFIVIAHSKDNRFTETRTLRLDGTSTSKSTISVRVETLICGRTFRLRLTKIILRTGLFSSEKMSHHEVHIPGLILMQRFKLRTRVSRTTPCS